MKAAQIVEPNKIVVVDKEMPVLADGNEVLVRVRMIGICGSDLHVLHGTNPFAIYPRVFGHEVTGEVAEIGKNVKDLAIGDHVVMEPISYCGKCYACRSGRPNVCESLQVYGVHRDGGCQEYMVLPASKVHRVDKSLKWEEVVLAEPFTIGAQVIGRGDVKQDDVVLIFGAGPIGLCILQMAKLKGATCIVTDVVAGKLDYAKSIGADHTLNAKEVNIHEEIVRLTEGMGANVTIDTVCTPKTFEDAVKITSAAGRVVVIGFNEKPSSIAQMNITKKELAVVGSRLQTHRFPEVIQLLNERKLNTASFVTQHYAIDDIQAAFHFYEVNPNAVRKIVVEF